MSENSNITDPYLPQEKTSKFKKVLLDIFGYREHTDYNFRLEPVDSNDSIDIPDRSKENKTEIEVIFPSLEVNLEHIKSLYQIQINSDVMIREFHLNCRNKQYSAFLLYIDGMVDSKTINDFVLEPLMLKNRANTFEGNQDRILSEAVTNNITVRKVKKFNLEDYIFDSLMPQNNVKKTTQFAEIISDVNSGNCAMFIDTMNIAFNIDVKGFEKRSISTPTNEVVIRGSR